jgi:hypothetical protein
LPAIQYTAQSVPVHSLINRCPAPPRTHRINGQWHALENRRQTFHGGGVRDIATRNVKGTASKIPEGFGTVDQPKNPLALGGKKFGCGLPKETTADDENFRIHSQLGKISSG